MGIFAARGRAEGRGVPRDGAATAPTASPRFDAVAEALAEGVDVVNACVVAGTALAHDGASIEEVLAGLRETWQGARGEDPTFEALTALLGAWSDSTLGYLNQLSCNDPLTGLSSATHLRGRLSELFRVPGADVNAEWALVVCELPSPPGGNQVRVERALELANAGEHVRTVFPFEGVVARLGAARVVVLTRRDERLGRRVRLLRMLLNDAEPAVGGGPSLTSGAWPTDAERRVRVWIESLGSSDATAGMLLDDLAR